MNSSCIEQTKRLNQAGNKLVLDPIPSLSKEQVQSCIARADQAALVAKNLSVNLRVTVLTEVANKLDMRKEWFAQLIASEGIKTIREARKEVARCIDTFRLSAEEARRLNGQTIPFDQAKGSENRVGYFKRIPLGIIAAITPFNDPLNLVAHKIGPAIAAGNAVILAPHEHTPRVAMALMDIFSQTQLPTDVLQIVTGEGAIVGDTLVRDPRIRMISFTGGSRVGLEILKNAGLKKVSLELGSNCPAIVMQDADVELALNATISGAFWAAGQNCLHVQRIFIHESLFNSFRDQFVQRAKNIRIGDKLDEQTDMGPLINLAAAKRVQSMVKDAIDKGAELLCGGYHEGAFYAPTVITNVPPKCKIDQDEVFGPVTLLYSFNNENDAITQANSVDYGLQAGIFTRDLYTAFRLADLLECGGVIINDSSDYRIDNMPFGGTKGSGLGREGVVHAIQEMSEPKMYCFNLS